MLLSTDLIKDSIYLLAIGSNPTLGSSKNIIVGFKNIVRAVHSFLLFPPLNTFINFDPLSNWITSYIKLNLDLIC
jgi:hypothetical protein